MQTRKISTIVPAYNEEKLIGQCLLALINQNYPQKDYEIVVVDDGSADSTLKAIMGKKAEAKKKGITLRLIRLEKNRGQIIARETGAKKARHQNLLFIDSRCQAHKNVLRNIREINYQPIVGNPIIDHRRSFLDRFGYLFRKKLYFPYFGKNFKAVFITKNNFDEIGKGTTVFFCDKELFLSSQPKNKGQYTSVDTRLLWNIVQKRKILKHPNVKVTYLPRLSLKEEIRHTFQRGPRFVDYYTNPQKKYFWLLIFLPITVLILTILLTFIDMTYFFYWSLFLVLIWIFGSIWLAENIKDFFIVFGLLPIFGASFGLGIARGLLIKLRLFFSLKMGYDG